MDTPGPADSPSVTTDLQPGPDTVGDTSGAARTATTGPQEATGRVDGRDSKGQFAKGNSINPTGTAKANRQGSLSKALDGIVDRSILAKTLWNLAQGLDVHGRRYKRPNLSVQMAAVQYVYDRLEGKPLMQLRHEGDALAGIIIMHPGRMAPEELIEAEARDVTDEAQSAPDDLEVNRAPSE